MGISGLLPLLKDISTTTHISKFAGLTLGVDAYVWLHKGAYGCAQELVLGEETTKYVDYALHRVRMLKHFNITPYIVFDGDNLPSKSGTETDRGKRREEALARARILLREERFKEARDCFAKCIDITPEMAYQLIKALKAEGVSYVVSPYEADAQLTFLEKVGLIDGIITEDSDLLVFGCKRVLFKFDSDGDCEEVLASKLGQVKTLSFVGWGIKEFRQMAILSGCDYLPSINGMGLKKSHALLRRCKTIEKLLQIVRFDGSMKVPKDYAMEFRRAELTFEHQRVFDPRGENGGQLSYLNPLPEGVQDCDMPFIGARMDDEIARGIARGEIDPISKEKMRDIAPNFTPQTSSGSNKFKFKPSTKSTSNPSKSFYASEKGGKSASKSTSSSPQKQIQGQSSLLKFLRRKPEAAGLSSASNESPSRSKAAASIAKSTPKRSPLKNLNQTSSSSPMMVLTESQEATLESEEEAFKLRKERKLIGVETTSRFFQGKNKKVEVTPDLEEQEEEEGEEAKKSSDEEMEEDSEKEDEGSTVSLASRFTYQKATVGLKRKRSCESIGVETKVVMKERREDSASEPSSDQPQPSGNYSKDINHDDSGFWQDLDKVKNKDGADEWDCEDLENLISGKGWTPPAVKSKPKRSGVDEDGKNHDLSRMKPKDGCIEGIEDDDRVRSKSLESEGLSLSSCPSANKKIEDGIPVSDQMQGILAHESEEDDSEGVLSSPYSQAEDFRASKYGSPVSPLQERNLNYKSAPSRSKDESRDQVWERGLLSQAEENQIEASHPSSDPIESDSSPTLPAGRFTSGSGIRSRFGDDPCVSNPSNGTGEDSEAMNQDDVDEEEEARIESVSRGLRERFSFKSPAPNRFNFGRGNEPSENLPCSSDSLRASGPSHPNRSNSHSNPGFIPKSISTPKLQFQRQESSSSNSFQRSISRRSISLALASPAAKEPKDTNAFRFGDRGERKIGGSIGADNAEEVGSGLKRMGASHVNGKERKLSREKNVAMESPAVDRAKRLGMNQSLFHFQGKGKWTQDSENVQHAQESQEFKSPLEKFRFVKKR